MNRALPRKREPGASVDIDIATIAAEQYTDLDRRVTFTVAKLTAQLEALDHFFRAATQFKEHHPARGTDEALESPEVPELQQTTEHQAETPFGISETPRALEDDSSMGDPVGGVAESHHDFNLKEKSGETKSIQKPCSVEELQGEEEDHCRSFSCLHTKSSCPEPQSLLDDTPHIQGPKATREDLMGAAGTSLVCSQGTTGTSGPLNRPALHSTLSPRPRQKGAASRLLRFPVASLLHDVSNLSSYQENKVEKNKEHIKAVGGRGDAKVPSEINENLQVHKPSQATQSPPPCSPVPPAPCVRSSP